MITTLCRPAILEALTSTLDLNQALERLLHALDAAAREASGLEGGRWGAFPAKGVFMNIYKPDENAVYFFAGARRGEPQRINRAVPVKAGMKRLWAQTNAARAADADLSVRIVNRLADDPFTAYVAPQVVPEIASFLMMKLRLEGQRYGIVCFWSDRAGAFHSEHAAWLAGSETLLSLHAGFAISAELSRQRTALTTENRQLVASLSSIREEPLSILLANTPSMHRIANDIKLAARFNENLLITGESGTGKEVVAQTVHALSDRSRSPFVRVNCSAIPENLIESELFGHEAGAFTGAERRHTGYFEEADGGTLFLDEIGELPLGMQAKLLHVLQNRTVRRVGGTAEIPVDVRIIGATNRDLEALVRDGRFRLDLFYRLNVLPIRLKPLRERPEDVAPLARLFIWRFVKSYGLAEEPVLTEAAIEGALRMPWPGNVRELKNVVSRTLMQTNGVIESFVYSPDDETLALPTAGAVGSAAAAVGASAAARPDALAATERFDEMQRRYFSELLSRTKGRIAGPGGAAELSGINVNTLRSRLRRLGFERFSRS
ncbi:sigma-54-dependent Fis family transcriptional regulator [Sutterella sp.]|uniref:sigma-54-dependent Fis family transcriptional regulator n=1 Tax=Sutterella sp. TaxID=1981025 RepID=UPI003FD6E95B